MQKYAGTIITWLICQQAIQERDRELYTYALYNMVLLIIPLGLTVIFGEIIGNVKQGIVMILPFIMLMCGKETTTKTKQGQPPRLYSEQEGHRFFL